MDFQYPPSVQADLFNYLKPEQQQKMRGILRTLKKEAQVELSICLIDYMETAQYIAPSNPLLAQIFHHIIDKEIVRPLAIH